MAKLVPFACPRAPGARRLPRGRKRRRRRRDRPGQVHHDGVRRRSTLPGGEVAARRGHLRRGSCCPTAGSRASTRRPRPRGRRRPDIRRGARHAAGRPAVVLYTDGVIEARRRGALRDRAARRAARARAKLARAAGQRGTPGRGHAAASSPWVPSFTAAADGAAAGRAARRARASATAGERRSHPRVDLACDRSVGRMWRRRGRAGRATTDLVVAHGPGVGGWALPELDEALDLVARLGLAVRLDVKVRGARGPDRRGGTPARPARPELRQLAVARRPRGPSRRRRRALPRGSLSRRIGSGSTGSLARPACRRASQGSAPCCRAACRAGSARGRDARRRSTGPSWRRGRSRRATARRRRLRVDRERACARNNPGRKRYRRYHHDDPRILPAG